MSISPITVATTMSSSIANVMSASGTLNRRASGA
jgi:hypothetical protein